MEIGTRVFIKSMKKYGIVVESTQFPYGRIPGHWPLVHIEKYDHSFRSGEYFDPTDLEVLSPVTTNRSRVDRFYQIQEFFESQDPKTEDIASNYARFLLKELESCHKAIQRLEDLCSCDAYECDCYWVKEDCRQQLMNLTSEEYEEDRLKAEEATRAKRKATWAAKKLLKEKV